MPDGFKFPTAEELKGKIKPRRIPEIPLEEDSLPMKILTGQDITGLGQNAQFEHNIRNRRLDMPEFDPTGMAGTTKYLVGKGRTPSEWLRKGGTANFLKDIVERFPRKQGLTGWMPSRQEEAANILTASRKEGGIAKPRVAAHMRPVNYEGKTLLREPVPHETSYSSGVPPKISRKYKVEFNPETRPTDVQESFFREAVKTAQRLGNPQREDMIMAFERAFGKEPGINPFDYNVNIIAKRKMGHKMIAPPNAVEQYKRAYEKLAPGSPTRQMLEQAMKRR